PARRWPMLPERTIPSARGKRSAPIRHRDFAETALWTRDRAIPRTLDALPASTQPSAGEFPRKKPDDSLLASRRRAGAWAALPAFAARGDKPRPGGAAPSPDKCGQNNRW